MVNDEKFCPIMICAHENGGRCMETDCTWWQWYAKECAVSLLAGMFADSEICRSVFEEVVGDE